LWLRLKTQTALAIKEALRGIDVLVIDELAVPARKLTQAEFLPHPERADRCRPPSW